MATEEPGSPGILKQQPFTAFDTLADAIAGLAFKTKGLEVYIISEDKEYYWKNDIDGFVNEEVHSDDIEITDFTKGIILRSPNNSRWRITIDNTGSLIITSI